MRVWLALLGGLEGCAPVLHSPAFERSLDKVAEAPPLIHAAVETHVREHGGL